MSDKPLAQLEQWTYNKENNLLTGIVYNHAVYTNGHKISTNRVKAYDGLYAETQNTLYRLGLPLGPAASAEEEDKLRTSPVQALTVLTSDEWSKTPEFSVNFITDKCGWYKDYLKKAWYEELITREEYKRREAASVVIYATDSVVENA